MDVEFALSILCVGGRKAIRIVAFDSKGTAIIFDECTYWKGKVSINGFADDLIALVACRDNLLLCQ